MKVHLLTTEQKDLLISKKINEATIFNPTQDANNNWFISIEEVEQNETEELNWVKDLPLIDYLENNNDI